jgi:CheY-like chemotaxis protein
MIRSIIKRDGRVVFYDESKIASAALRAMEAAGDGNAQAASVVANAVHTRLEKECGSTRFIRSMERPDSKPIPIIAMTADAFEEDLRRAKDAGVNDYLAKPIDRHSAGCVRASGEPVCGELHRCAADELL